ncbi:MAG: hypothetical protein OIF34_01985, partial [Porticoccaceae bacterium]|nr:hypothetical protein [Porticoccaceae bacterium]
MKHLQIMPKTPLNPPSSSDLTDHDPQDADSGGSLALPSHVVGSGVMDRLADSARDYARASTAENTNRAYAADWKHFARWCRMKGTDPLPPSPEVVALYL